MVQALIKSAATALVLALVFAALASAGVVSVNLAHCLLLIAWIVAAITLLSSLPKWSALTVAALILISVLFIGLDRWMVRAAAEHEKPLTRSDIGDVVREEVQRALSHTPTVPASEENLPGLALHAILRLHDVTSKSRKYVFDFGRSDAPRLSIYLDPDNIFTLAATSAAGEPYLVQVPSCSSGTDGCVPLEAFIYLACEFGTGDGLSMFRIAVNGHEVGSLNVRFKVDLDSLATAGGVMGADLHGEHGARIDIVESILYDLMLTNADREKLVDHFRNRPLTKFVEFGGTQWMRFASHSGANQVIPEYQPHYRVVQ